MEEKLCIQSITSVAFTNFPPHLAFPFLPAQLEFDIGITQTIVVHGDHIPSLQQGDGDHPYPYLGLALSCAARSPLCLSVLPQTELYKEIKMKDS